MAIAGSINNHAGLIWSIADLLRGDYKQSEYGRVILPLVVLRRLDCVLAPTKQQVLDRLTALKGRVENVGPVLQAITGIEVYNTNRLTLKGILADPAQVAGNLRALIASHAKGEAMDALRVPAPRKVDSPEALISPPASGHRRARRVAMGISLVAVAVAIATIFIQAGTPAALAFPALLALLTWRWQHRGV